MIDFSTSLRKQGVRVFAGLLMVSAMLSIPACQRNTKAAAREQLKKAEQDIAAGNTEAAIIELRRAVQLDDGLAEAHYRLGTVLLNEGNPRGAYQEFTTATRRNPDLREAQVSLADMQISASQWSMALAQADIILKKWPNDNIGKVIQAEATMGGGKIDEGRKLLEAVLRNDPNNARAVFDEAILQLHSNDLDGAEASLKKTLELTPGALKPLGILVNVYQAKKQNDQALALLQDNVKQFPKNVGGRVMLADFYAGHGNLPQAEIEFRNAAQLGDGNPTSRGVLARFYLVTGRVDDAEREYNAIITKHPDDVVNMRQLAEVEYRVKKNDEAMRLIGRLLERNAKDAAAIRLRGQIELDSGKVDSAILSLEQARNLDPSYPTTYLQLTRAELARGNTERASQHLLELLDRDPNNATALSLLAHLELRTGKIDSAIGRLDQLVGKRPNDVSAQLLLAQALAQRGDFRTAEGNLNDLLAKRQQDQSRGEILEALGWISVQQHKYTEAEKTAKEALHVNPRSESGLILLVSSYAEDKMADRGLKEAKAYVDQTKAWPGGYGVLGSLALRYNNPDMAEASFRNVLKTTPDSLGAEKGLAEVAVQRNKIDDAIAQYEALVKKAPKDASSYVRLGQLYESKGNWQQGRKLYEQANAMNFTSALLRNNLAWNYAEHGGDLNVALKLAQQAKESSPDDPSINDTLGWIYVKMGVNQTAVELFKHCLSKQPDNPTYQYHLGTAYFNMGQWQDARKSLNAAVSANNFADLAAAKNLLARVPN